VIARSDAASGGFEKPDGKPLRFDWAAVRRGDALDVSKADVRLGESIVHVEAKLANLATEPGGTFALRSERIAFSELGMPTREGARGDEIRDLAIDGRIAIPSSGPKLTIGLVSPSGVAGGAEYDDLRVDFEFARQRATISSLRIGAFDGEVRANGYYDLGAQDRPSFDLVTALEKVSVPKLVESQAPSLVGRVEGVLAANLSVRGSGSAWEEIRQQMVGGGNLVMEDGTLKDVNVADAVLKGVTGVAGLSQLISPQIRGKYPSLFGVGDTVFEKLDAKLDIRDGIARIQDFRLAARDYSLSGEGRYELRNALDMRVAMTLSEALTGDLVDSVKQARYLENSGGRIEIPARLRGGIPNVKAEPDLSGVASTLQAELVGGLLKGALGEKKEGDAGESEGEELLRRGLNSLLGGGKK